jgi:hypothetical protein
MRWLIWRELIIIGRMPSFWLAAAVYVSVLALFVVIWGDGVPIVGAGPVWDQFSAVQLSVLLALLPWTATRCVTTRRKRDLTVLAIVTASRPSALVLARCIALSAALFVLVLTALPIAIVMQQIAAIPFSAIGRALLPLLGLSLFVAVAATGFMLAFANPLPAWVITSAVTVVASRTVALTPASTPVWIGIALGAAVLLTVNADSRLAYRVEERT